MGSEAAGVIGDCMNDSQYSGSVTLVNLLEKYNFAKAVIASLKVPEGVKVFIDRNELDIKIGNTTIQVANPIFDGYGENRIVSLNLNDVVRSLQEEIEDIRFTKYSQCF